MLFRSSIINFANVYTQLVYNTYNINAFISASANSNWYKRVDRFNYIKDTDSDIVTKPGFDIRAGFLINPNEYQSVYVNASNISRAPYFKYVFGNYTNVVVADLKNENVSTIEFGYKLAWRYIRANLNLYTTSRKNVSMLSNEYVQLEDNSQTRAMINGLNSIHKGLELEMNIDISRNFKFGGWLSLGNFTWQNNVNTTLFNDNNVPVDTINVYAKNLHIGGTAQQQVGIFTDLKILNSILLKVEYQYLDGMYADFNPTNRNNPEDISQPFQLPAYGVVNAYLGFPFSINKYYGRIQINGYNILNSKHIVLGEDGINHNLETFTGFWSFGRNLTFSLKFNF